MNKLQSEHFIHILSMVKIVIFDFDGVFTDNTVIVSQEGLESVCCWRSDGLGLKRLQSLGILTLILSTESNPVVSVRAAKLKIKCWQDIENKAEAIQQIANEYQVDLAEIAYIGNDINDTAAFKIVGAPIAVRDAYPEVLPFVLYRTNTCGGKGAVREVCDLIYQIKTSA